MFLFLSDMHDSDTTLASKKEYIAKADSRKSFVDGNTTSRDLKFNLKATSDSTAKDKPTPIRRKLDKEDEALVASLGSSDVDMGVNNGDVIPRLKCNSQNREMVESDTNEEYDETTHEKK